jgi:hypothetical protein
VAQPRRATPPLRISRQRKFTSPRRTAGTPGQNDTSLESIFKQRRFDATAPLDGLAPRSGPAASHRGTRRTMTYHYAAEAPAPEMGPCPSRPSAALAPLFACTLR